MLLLFSSAAEGSSGTGTAPLAAFSLLAIDAGWFGAVAQQAGWFDDLLVAPPETDSGTGGAAVDTLVLMRRRGRR